MPLDGKALLLPSAHSLPAMLSLHAQVYLHPKCIPAKSFQLVATCKRHYTKALFFFFLSLVLQLKTQLLNSSWGTADIRSCSDTKVLSWSESVCKAGTKCLRLRAHSAALVVMGGPCPGLCNTSCLPTPNSSPSLAMVVVPQASPATQVQMEVPQTKVISTRHWKAVWDS